MPIYPYQCQCGVSGVEKVQGFSAPAPLCPSCGRPMERAVTYPAMVKIKGEGGYPSRRKMMKGSAPGTTRSTKAFGSVDPTGKQVNYFGRKEFNAAP